MSDKHITGWTIAPQHGVEVVSARMGPHGLDGHFHDAWSIGVILEGTCSFRAGNREYEARQGDLFLIPPFEVHACSAASSDVRYKVLYIGDTCLQKIDAGRFSALANASSRVFTAPPLAGHIAALDTRHVDAPRTDALLRALAALLPSPRETRVRERELHPLQNAMHRLWQSDVEAGELVERLPHSRWHTLRTFRSQTGLSPSAYLRQLRALKARFLLNQQQASLSDLALLLHFTDQAHFTRTFKAVFGVTPGRLRKVIQRR
ncbi:helix-turn-helix domain-containing protein [Aromatoleum toluvorans]|uniref:Helix-turn-helix domain-containing protein n=1 Tax=Aromatoleum toluvorans TaxID=92002 RepID=A0ABX1PZS6_9RHOO|nr:AraC family transcriptional regulator [Aromatoleum toluvorans]NMG44942.1 helix-turn-helix domain-containing protein [Aromatoleum toluvorans]